MLNSISGIEMLVSNLLYQVNTTIYIFYYYFKVYVYKYITKNIFKLCIIFYMSQGWLAKLFAEIKKQFE